DLLDASDIVSDADEVLVQSPPNEVVALAAEDEANVSSYNIETVEEAAEPSRYDSSIELVDVLVDDQDTAVVDVLEDGSEGADLLSGDAEVDADGDDVAN
ncbi:hypothetical protein B5M09_000729, partial [Aphanomyces astaci]